MHVKDCADITLPEIVRPLEQESADQLRLTILFHPQLENIGQVADLRFSGPDKVAELSRLEPEFKDLRTGAVSILDDPYISRSAFTLTRDGEGVKIAMPRAGSSLAVDGEIVNDCHCMSLEQLEQGLVLAISRRIVLLLKLTHCPKTLPPECGLVGESGSLQRLRSAVQLAADCDLPVLILGETGVGKELAAQAIHQLSRRSGEPMVAINMAAIPKELASAELFGVSRGAYTGAETDRPGYFSKADGGTIFLDEIGECAAKIQAQLLRTLETGEVQIAGGEQTQLDFRIVAATDADLNDEERGFSSALLHRLGGIEIRMPSLMQRREDIGRLLREFILQYEQENKTAIYHGKEDPVAAAQWAALTAAFAGYSWPGNVRELRNSCFQLAAVCHQQGRFQLPDNLRRKLADGGPPPLGREATRNYRPPAEIPLEEIAEAMEKTRYELAAAARHLNMSRPSLYKRMQDIPELRLAGDIPIDEVTAVHTKFAGDLGRAAAHLLVSAPALLRRWHALELEERRPQ